MKWLLITLYGEAALHVGYLIGALNGFYGWHP